MAIKRSSFARALALVEARLNTHASSSTQRCSIPTNHTVQYSTKVQYSYKSYSTAKVGNSCKFIYAKEQ